MTAPVESTPLDRAVSYEEAAQAIVAILAANGVRELFTMPGDAFPVLEAIARAEERRLPAPRIATCLHEIVAVAAAHGFQMVSRVPQACLLHVDLGVQMAGAMLHNAQRARAGMVLLVGRSPGTWDGTLRGGRAIEEHWIQDRQDLGGTARDYVKWSYDLQRVEPLPFVMQRALQIAAADPAGPVFVSLLREMLMEPLDAVLPAPDRHRPPAPSIPDLAALETLADWICSARSPIAIAGHSGRDPSAFAALGEFASESGVPIYSRNARANISTDHHMYLGSDPAAALASADLVILLDVDVPWIPLFHSLRDDARVAHIHIDPLMPDMGLWSFPCDLLMGGSTAAALPVLTELVRERRTTAQRVVADKRTDAVRARHRQLHEAQAGTPPSRGPATPADVARTVAAAVGDDTVVVDDSTTAIPVNAAEIPIRVAGSYFQPIGSALGWGAGASLGAKLAAPDKTVISLNAEGSFFEGAPEAALWGAARLGAPFLTVVYNNAQYAAIKLGVRHEYPGSALARSGTALDLDRAPDIVGLARSAEAYAARVDDVHGLPDALTRALEVVRGGQCAVLDVAVQGP